jgi:hypothetical protein
MISSASYKYTCLDRDNWSKDYEEMKSAMIYGESPTFSELIQSMQALENKFRNRNTLSVVSVRSVCP